MNKCEKSQLSINQQIQALYEIYAKESSKGFHNQGQKPETLQWRKKLMAVYTCIERYSKHI